MELRGYLWSWNLCLFPKLQLEYMYLRNRRWEWPPVMLFMLTRQARIEWAPFLSLPLCSSSVTKNGTLRRPFSAHPPLWFEGHAFQNDTRDRGILLPSPSSALSSFPFLFHLHPQRPFRFCHAIIALRFRHRTLKNLSPHGLHLSVLTFRP